MLVNPTAGFFIGGEKFLSGCIGQVKNSMVNSCACTYMNIYLSMSGNLATIDIVKIAIFNIQKYNHSTNYKRDLIWIQGGDSISGAPNS